MGIKQAWGEHRVYFQDEQGRLRRLPARWTNAVEPDPFVVIAAGRALFRFEDLLRLVELVSAGGPAQRGPAKGRRKRKKMS